MLRSILAVVAGYIVIAAVTMLTTVLAALAAGVPLEVPGPDSPPPPAAYLAGNIVGSALAALLGGVAAARIALRHRLGHAFALAALVFVLGVAYALTSTGPAPAWYFWLLPVLGALGVSLGGVIATRRLRVSGAAAIAQ